MRELADDTARIFLENENSEKAAAKILAGIEGLRLFTFENTYQEPGRYRIRLQSSSPTTLRGQKGIVVPE
jgi:hypothetical protein